MAEADTELQDRFLHLRLVEFITTGNRVFRCEWPSTWRDFLNEFPQYYDLSCDFIKKEFFENVLPRIHDFDLSPEQKKCVKLFDSYPGVVETPQGYKLIINENALQEKLNTDLKDGEHYVKFEKFDPKLHGNISTILTDTENFSQLKRKFCNDPVIQTWCSALLANDDELMNEVLLPYEEIKARILRIRDHVRSTNTVRPYLDRKRVEDHFKRHKEFKEVLLKRISELSKTRRRTRFGQ